MRVITLAGSPRYPSRSSALLEYARETLTAADIEVCHWHLQNFAPEDLLYARFDNPALQTLNVLPERALEGKIVLPLATGGTIAHMLAVDYALKPVLNALKAQEILHGVFADDSQVTDYQHKPQFTANLQRRLDDALETFWQALHRPSSRAPSLTSLRGVEHA
ncbi:TPA: NAD(P)H-dependent oxidoreductase [Klebsiella pneumoniae]|nr:NAD(P)H-dependent oxidoreductase [Klebsiella pneumoniae]